MSKKRRIYQIDRRTFLKGLGASVVSLPMFDFFLNTHGTAYAQGDAFAKRYLIVMNGLSPSRGSANFLKPSGSGMNYTNVNALRALNDFPELRSYLGIYSDLYLPFTSFNASGPAPTAGYKGNFHNVAAEVQLTGTRVEQGVRSLRAPSSDQILRAALNSQGNYNHLNICVQPRGYLGGNGGGRRFTQFNSNGSGIAPQTSPRAVFDSLFFNLKESDPEAERQRFLASEKRRSVLDLIAKERVDFLKRELAPREKAQLADHFDQIRDLEKSLETVEDPGDGPTCRKPAEPRDPAEGADYVGRQQDNTNPNLGYSNEDRRADLMNELVHMAFSCDIARHGTLRLTLNQSYVNMYEIAGYVSDYHEMSHYKGPEANFIRAIEWHVRKYADLLERLRTTPEGGGNILDNSAILFVSEGGGGRNSDTGSGNSAHSGYNMVTMVAGRAGGLRPAGHKSLNELHPSRIIFSAMRAAGYTGNSLGEVSGIVNDMF